MSSLGERRLAKIITPPTSPHGTTGATKSEISPADLVQSFQDNIKYRRLESLIYCMQTEMKRAEKELCLLRTDVDVLMNDQKRRLPPLLDHGEGHHHHHHHQHRSPDTGQQQPERGPVPLIQHRHTVSTGATQLIRHSTEPPHRPRSLRHLSSEPVFSRVEDTRAVSPDVSPSDGSRHFGGHPEQPSFTLSSPDGSHPDGYTLLKRLLAVSSRPTSPTATESVVSASPAPTGRSSSCASRPTTPGTAPHSPILSVVSDDDHEEGDEIISQTTDAIDPTGTFQVPVDPTDTIRGDPAQNAHGRGVAAHRTVHLVGVPPRGCGALKGSISSIVFVLRLFGRFLFDIVLRSRILAGFSAPDRSCVFAGRCNFVLVVLLSFDGFRCCALPPSPFLPTVSFPTILFVLVPGQHVSHRPGS
ncbi:hypothetical protein PAPYR_5746 [Paratrimastix pyriformis]|uniref:Uncharacterized protein n=1 Tax=Paratrimastix pyriformis TaxID=342808 RepID=A0ABQ8UH22_9EUKA|nr:hypothetical protein PAPYR_5746 [Paratrimastix pyriformis]